MKKLYATTSVSSLKTLQGKENAELRTLVSQLISWPTAYGMSNYKELWATAIEYFIHLPQFDRNKIIKLIDQNK